jgi:hypothetical protein
MKKCLVAELEYSLRNAGSLIFFPKNYFRSFVLRTKKKIILNGHLKTILLNLTEVKKKTLGFIIMLLFENPSVDKRIEFLRAYPSGFSAI